MLMVCEAGPKPVIDLSKLDRNEVADLVSTMMKMRADLGDKGFRLTFKKKKPGRVKTQA